jgi:hypothetical protein
MLRQQDLNFPKQEASIVHFLPRAARIISLKILPGCASHHPEMKGPAHANEGSQLIDCTQPRAILEEAFTQSQSRWRTRDIAVRYYFF